MKRISTSFLLMLLALGAQARPQTTAQTVHPSTTATVVHPLTTVEVKYPTTTVTVNRPTTQAEVVRPQTHVAVNHPMTTVQVNHPQTTVQVEHPLTTVEVIHPQTTVEVIHPHTPEDTAAEEGGKRGFTAGSAKTGATAQVTTSMSDFKPMQAKNFTAPDKAAPVGGGSMNLGNTTNQAEKDNANKASLLGAQTNQDMNVDPKQTQVKGLEKLLTDRAKFKEKQK